MPRLLYVFNSPQFFLSHRLHVAQKARERGYEVHVASTENGKEGPILEEGFPYHPIDLDRKGLRPGQELVTLRHVHRLYRDVEPDLVENATIKPVIYGGLAAHLMREAPAIVSWVTGLGHVFTRTDLAGRVLRAAINLAYRVALAHERNVCIFENGDDRRLFVETGLVPERRTKVIRGAGVDTSRFTPEWGDEADPPLVVTACRMLWPKGVSQFVEASRLLRERGSETRFVLVGDSDPGNPESVPREQLQEWDDEEGIEWWGFRDDMENVLAEASIFCLPSHYREGLPKALMEAAAAGLPIVTTDAPGCREVVEEDVNGYLVPRRDARRLADRLEDLLQSSARRREMGRASREIAERDFAKEGVIEANLAVYRAVLEGGRLPTD